MYLKIVETTSVIKNNEINSHINELGHSGFQEDSTSFYGSKRLDHSKTFFNPENIRKETSPTHVRFESGNVEGINNLYSFVNVLPKVFSDRKDIKVCDFGCGMHYFIYDLRLRFGWEGIGFDSDKQAIDIAKKRYTESSDSYVHLDLLKNKLPLADNSQDIVFSNAVIQHFNNDEFKYALTEINRVLKPGGVFLLIFKRNIDDWIEFSRKYNLEVDVIDQKEGIVKIEDGSMKKALAKSKDASKNYMRLYHCFSIAQVLSLAEDQGLQMIADLPWGNKKVEGLFTYNKGNKVPNAAVFFRKQR